MTSAEGSRFVLPTEISMTEFAARTPEEYEAREFLQKHYMPSCVTTGFTLGGQNIINWYHYLLSRTNPDIMENKPKLTTQEIFDNENQDPLLAQAQEKFCRSLGKELSVMSMKYLPTGGIYLIGGVIEANQDALLSSTPLREEFLRIEPLIPLIRDIPVRIVTSSNLALSGCLVYAKEMLF